MSEVNTTENRISISVKWKSLKDFPEYSISNNGLLRKGSTLTNLKKNDKGKGYLFFTFYGKNKGVGFKIRHDIHKLVWEYFGDGSISSKDFHIDHINENSQDNRISNLQVISAKQNALKSQAARSLKTLTT